MVQKDLFECLTRGEESVIYSILDFVSSINKGFEILEVARCYGVGS